MFRRGALGVVGFIAISSPLLAAPKPVVLPSVYQKLVPTNINVSKKAPPCRIVIASIADIRRDQSVIGVLGRKPVYAPDDLDVWRKSIVRDLNSRGFSVAMPGEAADPSAAAAVDITLDKAWITLTMANLTTNVVFQMKGTTTSGEPIASEARGGIAKINWGSGTNEIILAMETAFSRSLDELALELQKHCPTARA